MNTRHPHNLLIQAGLFACLLSLFTFTGCTPVNKEEMNKARDIDLSDIRSRIKKTPRSSVLLEQEDDTGASQKSTKNTTIPKGNGSNKHLQKISHKQVKQETKTNDSQPSPGITLNFDNADIYEVIHIIGDLLKINYIIDPAVKGVVNIRSSKEIPVGQLREVFLKILHINGLDIRDEGDHNYIFTSPKPYSGKISSAEDIRDLKPSSRIILQIVPLLNLLATDTVKLIEPYLSPKGTLQALENHNWLLIHDYETNIVDILTILAKLDISPLSTLKVRLVRIQNAPIEEIKEELNEIFKALQINKGDQASLTIVPLAQVNSLLLVSPSDFLVDNGVRWIKELDIMTGSDRDNIYIYNARNTVASELADLVTRLITENHDTQTKKKTTTPTKTTQTLNTTTHKQNSKAPLSSLRFAGSPMLIADDNRNVVIIRALPPDYSRLVKLLERLDTLPRQVLVEVIVAEVYLKDELELGVEWALDNNLLGWQNSLDSTVFGDPLTTGLNMIISGGGDVYGLLNALAGTTNLSILSSPQVLVLNNETAIVNVGEEVPIVTTVTENESDGGDKVDKTIQYKDTGVILEVTPQINYDGIILLDIKQTISKALEVPEGGVQSAPIRKREVKTKLAIKDGQSILIGGLIGTDRTVSSSGVPLLKDIPLLGYLFKYESQKIEKTELLIMLTAYVIESEQVMNQYVKEFKVTMDGFRDEIHVEKD